jgi:uncharacterized membrane protein
MKRLIDESFVVSVPLAVAWEHLARIEQWPSWAKHIRSVERSPAGPLSIETSGAVRLVNGITSRFKMTAFEPMHHWKWRGSLMGAQIDYDHVFAEKEPRKTEIRFTVDASGWQAAIVGGVFAAIYRRNLRRAIPLLIDELEAQR